MSVLKRFRSESKMQFYATAQKLRKDIMTLHGGQTGSVSTAIGAL